MSLVRPSVPLNNSIGEKSMDEMNLQGALARVEVIEAFHRFFLSVDTRNWENLHEAMADEVTADYTELWGGEVKPQNRGALIEGWRHTLSGFQATQHLLGNEVVRLNGATAQVQAYFQARHFLPNERGSNLWDVGGRYTVHFLKQEDRWLLTDLKLHLGWTDGNLNLFELAAQRTQPSA
jgi:hypothetical protein